MWENDIQGAIDFLENLPTEGPEALVDRTDSPAFGQTAPAPAPRRIAVGAILPSPPGSRLGWGDGLASPGSPVDGRATLSRNAGEGLRSAGAIGLSAWAGGASSSLWKSNLDLGAAWVEKNTARSPPASRRRS